MTEADEDAELAPATPEADEANPGYDAAGALLATSQSRISYIMILRAATPEASELHQQGRVCKCPL